MPVHWSRGKLRLTNPVNTEEMRLRPPSIPQPTVNEFDLGLVNCLADIKIKCYADIIVQLVSCAVGENGVHTLIVWDGSDWPYASRPLYSKDADDGDFIPPLPQLAKTSRGRTVTIFAENFDNQCVNPMRSGEWLYVQSVHCQPTEASPFFSVMTLRDDYPRYIWRLDLPMHEGIFYEKQWSDAMERTENAQAMPADVILRLQQVVKTGYPVSWDEHSANEEYPISLELEQLRELILHGMDLEDMDMLEEADLEEVARRAIEKIKEVAATDDDAVQNEETGTSMENPNFVPDEADLPLISQGNGSDVIPTPPVERAQSPRGQEEEEETNGAGSHPSSPSSLPAHLRWRSTMAPRSTDAHDHDDERSLEGGMNGSSSSIASGGSGHCHDDIAKQATQRRAERVLWIVTALSVLFISVEAVGGFLAGSLAIITDAGHLLSDLLSFIISIVAIRTARHPASRRLSFGYHRAEILGALISIIILWVLTTVLVLLAIERIIENKYDVEADTMLITAGCGVVFNIVMAAVLMFGSGGHGHSHGGLSHGNHGHSHGGDEHGHSHEGAGNEARKNVNVRAAFVHIIGDLVQSVGVLIAAIIIKFTDWAIADPICTFVFSLIVLVTTITVLKDIFYVLMEATPPHIDYASLRADLGQLDNVAAVHDLHVWSLNMEKVALSVHLAVDQPDRACETIHAARQMILKRYSVHLVTIQAEQFDKSMNECDKCQPISS